MAYRDNESNTRIQRPRFSVDEWMQFRERLKTIVNSKKHISERDIQILEEIVANGKTTAQLAYLARTDEKYSWLKSNQNKPMSTRRIQQILTDYFPEFHIQKTHKKDKKDQLIRTEQVRIKEHVLQERGFCAWCGSTEKLDLHHMIPVFLGGTNDDRNLLFMCEKCHQIHTRYCQEIFKYGGGKKAILPKIQKGE